jgi:FtsH-binding integral membrane protein
MLLSRTLPACVEQKREGRNTLYWLKMLAMVTTAVAAVTWFFALFVGGSSNGVGRAVGLTVWTVLFWMLFGLVGWLKGRKRNID